ncbi:uncharacterized protein TNCV_3297601 [Trichonephila clavipes]|uniref:Uncharacterized protein n=1 Tax=Trichonephila clavipes TaxID=2585209 RepID=A0A8X6VTF4_TRICX|nr:uncharacterized protein TNCV_3297601 [Trichonephila clavipes]
MDGNQIQFILSHDPVTAPFFRGVYASDTIPILKKKSTIVVNLDASSQPRSHWLAFYHENNCIEFFDSYGYPLEYYGEGFRDFVPKFSTVSWNCIPFQSPTSNVCGAYCIYFIFKRSQGNSMYSITNTLLHCQKNDFRIFQFVKKRYGVRMIFRQ